MLIAVDDFRNVGRSGVFRLLVQLTQMVRKNRARAAPSGRWEWKVERGLRPEKPAPCGWDNLGPAEVLGGWVASGVGAS